MSQVDTLIDTIEEKAVKLSSMPGGASPPEMVQLLCDFDSALAQLRAQSRELCMMNQLLRERLSRSLERTQKLSGEGSLIANLGAARGTEPDAFSKLDPRA